MKVDELLDKYPLLKKITGPMVAGLLLLVWLNISFIGDFNYDFDISDMFAAFVGNFNLNDLFVSPEGLAMLSFVATNLLSGGVLSVTWLGATKLNLAMAVVYTVLKNVGIKNPKLLKMIKNKTSFKEWVEKDEIQTIPK